MARVGLDIRKWAMAGAQQRLAEIAAEAAAIQRAFPELRGARSRAGADATAQPARRRRRRRTMSAEARARISAAQKARWARQKGESGQTTPTSGTGRKKK